MKILQIFNKYSYLGGEEIAVEQISKDLSACHDLRSITFDSQDWVQESALLSRLRQFVLMAWNPGSIEQVRKELAEFRPDIVLLHNIMPVGSASLYVFLVDCGIPVVHYIHNFRPFSVNGYCWGNGRLLPQGLQKNFIPEIFAGSWQQSRIKTAWYAILIWSLHLRGIYRRIDGWIAISQFMKRSFVSAGVNESRIAVIPHRWKPQNTRLEGILPPSKDEPSFLFLGRLTEEKGILVLLDAWSIYEQTSEIGHLIIAGEGPLADEVGHRCALMKRSSFVGFKTGIEKDQLLFDCSALVVPSVWWEPLGLVLYEAYDYCKPVFAARSGGIVDHVEEGVTGWLHEPGDIGELASQLLAAAKSQDQLAAMGMNGKSRVRHYDTKVWISDFDKFVGSLIAESFKEPSIKPERGNESGTGANHAATTVSVYLADQNPGHDRSFGISRMSQVVLSALAETGQLQIEVVVSKTSQQAPADVGRIHVLPWGTRRKSVRLFTDHLHPIFHQHASGTVVRYYPKGYIPAFAAIRRPTVVTIHDTIIQYDEDHYPRWRKAWEYAYWSMMLKHTLRQADRIMTVSESSKRQILAFMERHRITPKDIVVTYEPCLYEHITQPEPPIKDNYVIHLASCEPHKRTAHLVRWWIQAEEARRELPMLHLIGTVPEEVETLLKTSKSMVKRPFLADEALQTAYRGARALILPSEIEGFGLPALEAYYLGTPVCFVRGTSVEEVLSVATSEGGFSLDDPESLFSALDAVIRMAPEEIRHCGLILRETYAARKVAGKMLEVFQDVAGTTH